MTIIRRFPRWALAVGLVFLQTPSWAAARAPTSNTEKTDGGFEFSIMESTQGNFGKLSIGAGYMGGGAYLDDKGVRREGLHASLTITIHGQPSQFQQPDVHEGQTLNVAGYRILVEKIIPENGADDRRGTIVLRIGGR
jgi:hypothetical protein